MTAPDKDEQRGSDYGGPRGYYGDGSEVRDGAGPRRPAEEWWSRRPPHRARFFMLLALCVIGLILIAYLFAK
jgi:hypothetical protein